MITITRNEEVVLNQIKIFDIEYPDGVPLNLLRKELWFSSNFGGTPGQGIGYF